MIFRAIAKTSRTVTCELSGNTPYYAAEPYDIYVNGELHTEKETRNIFTLFSLQPDTLYSIRVKSASSEFTRDVRTNTESALIDVSQCGAYRDGVHIDTGALQCAIALCPENGCVYVPAGTYLTGPIFLKSNMTLYLEKGAVLRGLKDRADYPIMPGTVKPSDGSGHDYYFGTWEGEPDSAMASLITGIDLKNVSVVGEGELNGSGEDGDWWEDHRHMRRAWRPRSVFLCRCENVLLQGFHVCNSPSWTLHPFYCTDLDIIDVRITNPPVSPNTDGIDPESCQKVRILGTVISVGDDCIAIKSSKIFFGKLLKVPSAEYEIRNCLMLRGHGGVVVGSEIAGGVSNIRISKCIFDDTDRGIRIKTRRGRGNDSVVDDIFCENVTMKGVHTPFVINMFYFCDLDGKTQYVWEKNPLPVDDRTPAVGTLRVRDVTCTGAHEAGCYFYGLPEQPIGCVSMKNVSISFAEDAVAGYPAMMSYITKECRRAMFACNVEEIDFENVTFEGYEGEKLLLSEVGKFVVDGKETPYEDCHPVKPDGSIPSEYSI